MIGSCWGTDEADDHMHFKILLIASINHGEVKRCFNVIKQPRAKAVSQVQRVISLFYYSIFVYTYAILVYHTFSAMRDTALVGHVSASR